MVSFYGTFICGVLSQLPLKLQLLGLLFCGLRAFDFG